MLLRIEIGEQLIRYTPPGRPNRTDFATFAREVSNENAAAVKATLFKNFYPLSTILSRREPTKLWLINDWQS